MVKLMKLKGQVRLNMDRTFTFISTLYDETQFECTVDLYDFEQNDEFLPGRYTVDGWLFVTQEAKQDTRCYLTLPKPTIQYGKQILVNELQLTPRGLTIADFNPQKTGGSVKQAKIEGGQVVEVSPEEIVSETLAKEAKPKRKKKVSKP
jgi:hypothetical protein